MNELNEFTVEFTLLTESYAKVVARSVNTETASNPAKEPAQTSPTLFFSPIGDQGERKEIIKDLGTPSNSMS